MDEILLYALLIILAFAALALVLIEKSATPKYVPLSMILFILLVPISSIALGRVERLTAVIRELSGPAYGSEYTLMALTIFLSMIIIVSSLALVTVFIRLVKLSYRDRRVADILA
jgi:hypothetical protein